MSSLRRITPLTIVLLTIVALSGCGSGSDGEGLETTDADAIAVKLEQVRERADAGRCTGDSSALSSLTSLREFTSGNALDYVSDTTREDLQELLRRLGEQIQSQCDQVSDLTTTTTTDETETSTETETTETETETSTDKTTTNTRDNTGTTTRETTTPRPPDGGDGGTDAGGQGSNGRPTGPGSSDSSGGIGPGAIASPFRSTPRYDRPSVPRSEDDPQRAAPGASR